MVLPDFLLLVLPPTHCMYLFSGLICAFPECRTYREVRALCCCNIIDERRKCLSNQPVGVFADSFVL